MTLPPVLLLPGMMLDGRMYGDQIQRLSSMTSVSAADLGNSSTIEGMAEDALHDAPKHFALVGLSMGGIVALEIWRQAPARVTHLALMDTTAAADRPERLPVRLAQMEAVQRGELTSVMMNELKPQYLAQHNRSNKQLLEQILAMAQSLGPAVFCRQSAALRDRVDRTSVLHSIKCPTLVVCGREDLLCPVSVHVAMAAAIDNADLLVLSHCGHLPPLERPQSVSTALLNLLGRDS